MFHEVQGLVFFNFFQVKELTSTAKNNQDYIEKSDLFEIFSKIKINHQVAKVRSLLKVKLKLKLNLLVFLCMKLAFQLSLKFPKNEFTVHNNT